MSGLLGLAPRIGQRKDLLLRALLIVAIAIGLGGCGKKGSPQPPPDEPNTYPRTYPSA